MSVAATKILMGSGATEATDDDFSSVTGLYHFDGSNGAQNNSYVDSSSTGKTLTKTGSLYQGSFSPFTADEGTWGVEFEESNSDHLIMDHSDFTFGTGDYTIECFVRFTGNSSTSGGIFAGGDPNGAVTVPALALRDTTGLTIYTGAGQKITGNTGLLSLGVWYHLAMVRASGVVRVYKDGALVTWNDGSTTVSDTGNITSSKFVIGKYYSDDYSLDGYISNFRVVKGSAVYTGTSFTAPTSPLTDITNTVLLTCRNNRFMDSSSEANAVSIAGGTPKIKPFSPFGSSAAYTATAKGGSIQVPTHVAPNNLTIAATSDFAFGTGDYTLEAWVYPTDLYNSATIGNFVIDFRSSGNTGANFMYLGVNGSGDGVLVPFSGSAVSGIDK